MDFLTSTFGLANLGFTLAPIQWEDLLQDLTAKDVHPNLCKYNMHGALHPSPTHTFMDWVTSTQCWINYEYNFALKEV